MKLQRAELFGQRCGRRREAAYGLGIAAAVQASLHGDQRHRGDDVARVIEHRGGQRCTAGVGNALRKTRCRNVSLDSAADRPRRDRTRRACTAKPRGSCSSFAISRCVNRRSRCAAKQRPMAELNSGRTVPSRTEEGLNSGLSARRTMAGPRFAQTASAAVPPVLSSEVIEMLLREFDHVQSAHRGQSQFESKGSEIVGGRRLAADARVRLECSSRDTCGLWEPASPRASRVP